MDTFNKRARGRERESGSERDRASRLYSDSWGDDLAFLRRLCGPNQICRTSAATQAMPQSINQSQQLPVDVLPLLHSLLFLLLLLLLLLVLVVLFYSKLWPSVAKHFGSHTHTHTTLCWLIKYAHKFKSRILLPRGLCHAPFPRPLVLATLWKGQAKRFRISSVWLKRLNVVRGFALSSFLFFSLFFFLIFLLLLLSSFSSFAFIAFQCKVFCCCHNAPWARILNWLTTLALGILFYFFCIFFGIFLAFFGIFHHAAYAVVGVDVA